MRARRSILATIAFVALPACGPVLRVETIHAALDASGNPRFVAYQGLAGETGARSVQRIVYAESSGATFRVESIAESEPSIDAKRASSLRFAIDEKGRSLLALERRTGMAVLVRRSPGSWSEALLESTLDEASRQVFAKTAGIGGFAKAKDGTLRLLADRFVFEVRDGAIVSSIDTGQSCAIHDECLFDEGEALRKKARSTLVCEGTSCTWKDATPIATEARPYSTRVFLHTSDALPMLVQASYAPVLDDSAIVVLATTGPQRELPTRRVYHLGAAARPAGGVAVATCTYEGAVALHLVSSDAPIRTLALGKVLAGFPTDPIPVLVSTASGKERVDVFVVTESDAVTHFRADVSTGQVVATKIPVGEP